MIAGAKIGDKISIELTTNRIIFGKLVEIKTFGIEINQKYLNYKDYSYNVMEEKEILTFLPFHNIIKITKSEE